jgi:PKD repeat protein
MMYKRNVSLFALLLVGVLGLVFLSASLAQAELPADVISIWRLEEDLTGQLTGTYVDAVGVAPGANPGQCSVGGCPTQVTGIVGFGQGFIEEVTGTNGIDVPDVNDDFDWAADQSFSIELWMKPIPGTTAAGDNVADREVMIGRTNSASAPTIVWFLGVESIPANKGKALFALTTGGTTINAVGTTNITATDDWYHIVGVRDATNKEIKVYVNGGLEATRTDTFTTGFAMANINLTNITMGWLKLNPLYFFNGDLDEVAIYSRALPEAEILQHYNDGLLGLGVGETPVAAFTGTPLSGAPGVAVDFTDGSTGNITSWAWDFGDGGTSTEQNPSHTYSAAGSYAVALTVTGPYGTDTETKADYVVVSANPPVANFTADPLEGTFPLTVNFTDASTPAVSITAWDWDFGDGQTSTEQNPSNNYAAAGTYTVTLNVTSTEGPGTISKDITLTEPQPVPPVSSGGGGGGGCFIGTIME